MIQELCDGIAYMLVAKFVLNDIPHAAGLLAKPDYSRRPTPGQLHYIASLCQQLKITTPYEEKTMTFGEAGRLIRELEAERKYRREHK